MKMAIHTYFHVLFDITSENYSVSNVYIYLQWLLYISNYHNDCRPGSYITEHKQKFFKHKCHDFKIIKDSKHTTSQWFSPSYTYDKIANNFGCQNRIYTPLMFSFTLCFTVSYFIQICFSSWFKLRVFAYLILSNETVDPEDSLSNQAPVIL